MDQVAGFLRSGALTWWSVTAAALSVLAGWLLARLARRWLTPALGRVSGLSPTFKAGAIRATRWFLLLLGFGVGVTFLGGDGEPLVAGAIVVSVVAVLALRGVANNFGASVVLQTRAPVHVGDEIASQDWEGVVQEVNGRSVVLLTVDGRTVHLPNAGVLDSPLDNHSEAGRRRDAVEVRLAGRLDPGTDALLRRAAGEAEGVAADPPPAVVVTAVDSSRTTLQVRYWHAPLGGPRTRSAVVLAVSEALRAARDAPWTVVAPPSAQPFVPPPPV